MKAKIQVGKLAAGAFDFESTHARLSLWLISQAVARLARPQETKLKSQTQILHSMKSASLKLLVAFGLAGLALTSTLCADVTLVMDGGNASRSVLFDRASNILSGYTVVVKDANTRSYINGTLIGNPGLGLVTIHFAQNGATLGLANLRDQAAELLATNGSAAPQITLSGASPETVGIDGSIFNSQPTFVVPFGYIKNSAKSPNLAGVTNLTQRQASYLQSASGTLPSAFFGGSATNDKVVVVGRDTGAAVRQIIDANIYFADTPSFYTTNRQAFITNAAFNAAFFGIYSNTPVGAAVPNPAVGHNSGALVVADLNTLTNAIGTVASGDFGTFATLSYEGYQPTVQNVAKGLYPIWGYERWYTKNTGAGQPSANQLTVITALYNAVVNFTFQHTPGNVFAVGKFVPLGDLEVERTSDGGPITSIRY
jgi:hypothetical protein